MNLKKKISRKAISYVLALVMVFSTLTGIVPGMSLTAKAAGTEYQIWIAGTQVTSENSGNVFAGDLTNDGKVQFTPADGTTPATLTLNGYSYEGDGGELNNQFFGILNKDADMPLNIKLQGENSVKLTGTGASYAIYSAADVTIEGDGSLDVAATGEKDYAIYGAKDLTISGGTINVEGGQYGIAVYGNFKTDGENVTVNAKAIGTQGVGINGITSAVFNKGTVTAEGKYAGIISLNGTVTVSGGHIEAKAESGGIVGTTVNLNGGEIIADGTAGYGVYAMGDNGLVSVGEQVTSITATGNLSAVNGKITNAVPGTGWTNREGTAGRKIIAVSAEGRSIASYKKLQFPPDHIHNFTYAAQGNTITATCDNANEKCNLNGNKIALTIVAPAVATNGNTKNAAATLSNLENFNEETELNVSADSIRYYNATKNGDTFEKNGTVLDGAPTDAGDYLAEITLTGVNTDQNEITSVSAVVGYTIKAPTPIAITIAGLGTSAIGNPTSITADATAWAGSYVYYGKYNDTPTKYRVLDKASNDFGVDGDSLLLDCNTVLYSAAFGSSNAWSSSSLRSGLQGDAFLNKTGVFTEQEKAAIASSTKPEAVTGDGSSAPNNLQYYSYVALDKDTVFALDAKEVCRSNYGYSSKDTRKKSGVARNRWWLRSVYTPKSNQGSSVDEYGGLYNYSLSGPFGLASWGVSPAFNVRLSSVIFASVITGTAGEAGAEYKLTLKDDNLGIALTSGKKVTQSESVLTIPYTVSGDNSANATQVSVLVTDKAYTDSDAKILKYGKAADVSSSSLSGTGAFELPSGLTGTLGTDYHIYLLAEDVNGEKETDYANLKEITADDISSKSAQTVNPPTAATNLTYTDQEQALLTGGATVATGNTEATVQYSLTPTDDNSWKSSLADIKAKNAGTYKVYYKVAGNDTYADFVPDNILNNLS